MRMTKSAWFIGAVAALPLLLAGCELGPKKTTQLGPRGTAMDLVQNPKLIKVNVPPPSAYPLENRDGDLARTVYPDLQVLGDISVDEFGLLMQNITNWVVPANLPDAEAGCNYCHNPENMASYEKYQKTVALKMLRMTRAVNTQWAPHVQKTGVTCYTCHGGNAIPANVWSSAGPPVTGLRGNKRGQNTPLASVHYASLPNDPFSRYLQGDRNIRLAADRIHPSAGHKVSIASTEGTYGLMQHMSGALGVNCTFCHNTQAFAQWKLSTPQRATAWYGIRMARDINNNYITPVTNVLPASQKGPHGDAWKVNCATCHQGLNKPLGGVSMLKDNPGLVGGRPGVVTAEAAPAAALPAAALVASAVR
jgi:photosynthetic reaction center cytochrome c subunit